MLLGTAEPLDLLLLQYAEEFHLHVGRQIADFVQEQRRPVGQLESADLFRQRPGVGALLPTEQLALDERSRNRRAVHANHRLAAARAQFVNRGRDQLLAGARLAQQENRGAGRRHLLDLCQDTLEGLALADNAGVSVQRLHLLLQIDVLLLQLVAQVLHFVEGPAELLLGLLPLGDINGDPHQRSDSPDEPSETLPRAEIQRTLPSGSKYDIQPEGPLSPATACCTA